MQDQPNSFPFPGQEGGNPGDLSYPQFGFVGPPSVVFAMVQGAIAQAEMERANAEAAQIQIFLLLLLSQT